LGDTTNYTLATNSQSNTSATIAKANVSLSGDAYVANKIYDGTDSAIVSLAPTGTVLIGNSTLANGATNTLSPLSLSDYVNTSASWANPAVGTQRYNLTYLPINGANYSITQLSSGYRYGEITGDTPKPSPGPSSQAMQIDAQNLVELSATLTTAPSSLRPIALSIMTGQQKIVNETDLLDIFYRGKWKSVVAVPE
jgi:hypothetical protein